MSKVAYLIIAISILVALLVIFVVSFVIYRRTPVPKGCEDMVMNEEKCSYCGHKECHFYNKENKE